MVYAEGGFYYRSELFPGGSDHVPDDPRGMYFPRAQEEMSGNGTGSPKWVMVRNLAHKLVCGAARASELYDLVEDPRELNNVHGDSKYAHLQQALMEHMIDWLIQTGDVPPLLAIRALRKASKPHQRGTCADLLQPDPSRQGWGESDRGDLSAGRPAPPPADLIAVNGVPHFST